MEKLVLFDFDGVIVDTHRPIPFVAKRLAKHLGVKKEKVKYFVNDLLRYYDNPNGPMLPYLERMFRNHMLPCAPRETARAYEMFQMWRTEGAAPMRNIEEFLIWARNNQVETKILTQPDEIKGLKTRRIKTSSVVYYFDAIDVMPFQPDKIKLYAQNCKKSDVLFITGDNKALSSAISVGVKTANLTDGPEAFSGTQLPTFRISDFTQLETILA